MNAAVLKTVIGASLSGVRIPDSPHKADKSAQKIEPQRNIVLRFFVLKNQKTFFECDILVESHIIRDKLREIPTKSGKTIWHSHSIMEKDVPGKCYEDQEKNYYVNEVAINYTAPLVYVASFFSNPLDKKLSKNKD